MKSFNTFKLIKKFIQDNAHITYPKTLLKLILSLKLSNKWDKSELKDNSLTSSVMQINYQSIDQN